MNKTTALFRIAILFALLPVLARSQPVYAGSLSPHNTILVDTYLDQYNTDPSHCSLREAIESANTDAAFGGCNAGSGTDTITFENHLNPIQLSISAGYESSNSAGDLNITSNMTIQGNGWQTTIIDASYQTTGSRIFKIQNNDVDLSVIIRNLTVTGGNSRAEGGGAISNLEDLLLEDMAIINSQTGEGNGGGIWTSPQNNGSTTLRRCVIQYNIAELKGGGIYANGTLIIEDSFIYHNDTLDEANGMGAGVYTLAPLTITGTTFKDNSSMNNAGNLYLYFNGGTATIEDSVFTGGNSEYGNGGNIFITRSPSSQPFITIRRTEISNGSAGYGLGGGIFNDSGFSLENVTVSGNSAETGGGIYSATASGGWPAIFKNITVAYNQHEDGSYGDGIYNANGGPISIYNSIVAMNGLPNTCGGHYCDCYTSVHISSGYNLERGTSCGFEAAGDIQNTDPSMGPLSDNWGQSRTHPLIFDSLAIDHGNNATCLSEDQRGWYRPLDGPDFDNPPIAVCDIGAYEFGYWLSFMPLLKKIP
jgi:CSLREA domain-containing protein